MNPQTKGIEDLFGTYAFDLRTSHRALKLNRFLWNMIRAESREAFLADEEGAMTRAGLSETEKSLLRAQDWLGLVQNGASFFVLEKFARVARKTNLEVYAMMRGESFEAFMATRRVPECR
jgi:protocatechuate 4,5-dioxygenase alpha chain